MNYIYLRKSRKDIELENDIDILERHERQLMELASRKDLLVPEENILREVVSGESISNRPMMQRLLKLIENGEVKNILCIEVERLSRGNSIDQGIITQAIVMNNVNIHTLSKTYDPSNEYDEEYFEFGLFMSRREYKTINRRLHRGRIQSAKEGKFISSVAPFGYDKIKLKGEKGWSLVPNEDAEIVRMIYNLTIEGLGAMKIANKLNEMGILTNTKKKWNKSSVRNLLCKEVYCGFVSYNRRPCYKSVVNNKITISRPLNKDYERIKGLHEPLIDEETFLKAQETIKRKPAASVPYKHELANPFTGIFKCGKCGYSMCRHKNYQTPSKDRLKCNNMHCDNGSISISIIEEKLISMLKDHLKDQKIYIENYEVEYVKKKEDFSKKIADIDKKIKDLDNQLLKICELLEKGLYSEDLFQSRCNSINEEKNSLNSLKNGFNKVIDNSHTEVIKKRIPILEKCIDNYFTLTPIEKNELLSALITKVNYIKKEKKGFWPSVDDIELEIIY